MSEHAFYREEHPLVFVITHYINLVGMTFLVLSGMYIHNWTPTVRQLFIASYLNVTPGTRTQNTDWALGGLSKANGYVLSSAVQWFPVKDFEIGFEVGYNRLNSSLTGTNGAAPSATGVPLVATNGSAWLGRMRVERNF